jgi:hypothetical protein
MVDHWNNCFKRTIHKRHSTDCEIICVVVLKIQIVNTVDDSDTKFGMIQKQVVRDVGYGYVAVPLVAVNSVDIVVHRYCTIHL